MRDRFFSGNYNVDSVYSTLMHQRHPNKASNSLPCTMMEHTPHDSIYGMFVIFERVKLNPDRNKFLIEFPAAETEEDKMTL